MIYTGWHLGFISGVEIKALDGKYSLPQIPVSVLVKAEIKTSPAFNPHRDLLTLHGGGWGWGSSSMESGGYVTMKGFDVGLGMGAAQALHVAQCGDFVEGSVQVVSIDYKCFRDVHEVLVGWLCGLSQVMASGPIGFDGGVGLGLRTELWLSQQQHHDKKIETLSQGIPGFHVVRDLIDYLYHMHISWFIDFNGLNSMDRYIIQMIKKKGAAKFHRFLRDLIVEEALEALPPAT